MKIRIELNPDSKQVEEIRNAIKDNDGYCCCAVDKTPETKCMCNDFRNNISIGYCHCGLYKKVKIEDDK